MVPDDECTCPRQARGPGSTHPESVLPDQHRVLSQFTRSFLCTCERSDRVILHAIKLVNQEPRQKKTRKSERTDHVGSDYDLVSEFLVPWALVPLDGTHRPERAQVSLGRPVGADCARPGVVSAPIVTAGDGKEAYVHMCDMFRVVSMIPLNCCSIVTPCRSMASPHWIACVLYGEESLGIVRLSSLLSQDGFKSYQDRIE